jgi:molybdopterin synthase catalytic subunit
MYATGVVGPGSAQLTERLAEFLADHGRVGVLLNDRHGGDHPSDGDTDAPSTDGGAAVMGSRTDEFGRYRAAGARPVYGLDEEGWGAVGEGLDLRDALYAMAPACDFCVVEGATRGIERPLPRVALGEEGAGGHPGTNADAEDDTTAGPVLARAPDAEGIDPEEVREALTSTEPIETLESLVGEAKRSPRAPQSGAIATFTGRVRAQEDAEDTATEYLAFEKYEGVAEKRMKGIGAELEERDGVHEVLMHHRSGRLDYGEDIVFVVVLAGHRGEAFDTVEDGIDRLKAEVPIFKKEVTVDEEFWVHDRP